MAIVINGDTGVSGVDGSAATPAVQGTDLNTGMFFPAADTIAFAEGGTEQMRLTDTGLLQFNSGYGSVATAYGCRAWVNFNGTGTVAIRASGNVTSITDNGTGDYTVNFTTAMPDANYSVTLGQDTWAIRAVSTATTSVRVANFVTTTGAAVDSTLDCVSVFR